MIIKKELLRKEQNAFNDKIIFMIQETQWRRLTFYWRGILLQSILISGFNDFRRSWLLLFLCLLLLSILFFFRFIKILLFWRIRRLMVICLVLFESKYKIICSLLWHLVVLCFFVEFRLNLDDFCVVDVLLFWLIFLWFVKYIHFLILIILNIPNSESCNLFINNMVGYNSI